MIFQYLTVCANSQLKHKLPNVDVTCNIYLCCVMFENAFTIHAALFAVGSYILCYNVYNVILAMCEYILCYNGYNVILAMCEYKYSLRALTLRKICPYHRILPRQKHNTLIVQ
jgi:hypothetical protein